MKRILFVEDNNSYRALLTEQLKEAGFIVDDVDSPLTGLENFAKHDYDLVLSDLKLPIMSGITFTESIKNIKADTLCIILTGDPDEETELDAIKNNIDLYIEKTKSFPVILEYINKLLEENKYVKSTEVFLESKREKILMNISEHVATRDNVDLELTPTEFELLKLFLRNKNQVVTREQFIDVIWEDSPEESNLRLVDSHIKRLRDKIRSFSIMTVRGYGYKWVEVDE